MSVKYFPSERNEIYSLRACSIAMECMRKETLSVPVIPSVVCIYSAPQYCRSFFFFIYSFLLTFYFTFPSAHIHLTPGQFMNVSRAYQSAWFNTVTMELKDKTRDSHFVSEILARDLSVLSPTDEQRSLAGCRLTRFPWFALYKSRI